MISIWHGQLLEFLCIPFGIATIWVGSVGRGEAFVCVCGGGSSWCRWGVSSLLLQCVFVLSRDDGLRVELADQLGRAASVARIHAAVGRGGGCLAIQRSGRCVGVRLDSKTGAAPTGQSVDRRGSSVLGRPGRAIRGSSRLPAGSPTGTALLHHHTKLFQFASGRLVLFGQTTSFFYGEETKKPVIDNILGRGTRTLYSIDADLRV